jgi:hypothetical protein
VVPERIERDTQFRLVRNQPDHTCKPGCGVCGKGDTRRLEGRKERRKANVPTRFHLEDA